MAKGMVIRASGFDERVFTNPYEPVDLKRVMTARKKYFDNIGGEAKC